MSIINHVTLQKIVAHDFRYDPRKMVCGKITLHVIIYSHVQLQLTHILHGGTTKLITNALHFSISLCTYQ